jgi:hypothetical protein
MKTLVLLFSAVALAVAADNPSLDGKWQIHSSIAGQDQNSTCTFKLKDTDLTGSCTAADGSEKNITGKVDGNKITWSYKSEYNGSPLTVNHEGTFGADNKITGTVSVPEFGVDGDFTGTHDQ